MLSGLRRRWRELRGTPEQPAPGTSMAVDWIGRGNAALAEGRLDEAREAYAHAREADPANPAAWLNHGFVALQAGELAAAEADLRQCLARTGPTQRTWHDAQFLLGEVLAGAGRHEEAAAAWVAVLAAAPGFDEARLALCRLCFDAGRPQQVVDLVAAAPARSVPLALAQAEALHALGRFEESLAVVDQVLMQDPNSAAALDGRGVTLLDLGRPAEAFASFERAAQAGGANADRLANLSAACQRLARLEDAIAYADRALELAPGDARARWNRALAHLLRGELAQGWEDFEARWDAGVVMGDHRLRSHAPRWDGQDLRGRAILLDLEQGLGDTIQFLRYVPELQARGARVAVRVQSPLVRLARHSLPQAAVLAPGDAPAAADCYCELMSLPRQLGIRQDGIPATVPYLHADPAAVAQWDARLAEAAQGRLRVGLVWSGNPAHLNDRNRSIPLQRLQALAEADALFVSLKPDPTDGERRTLAAWPRLFDAGPGLKDFADTAAVVQALDLVLAVDTSVAHLAGALGKPAWILLPWLPDWRWTLEREDSPWYPSARLYRQAQPQDWSAPLQRVQADLQARIDARRGA